MILNENQLKQYFSRIGLRYEDYADRELDSAYLKELSIVHSTTMPFENLDIEASYRSRCYFKQAGGGIRLC